MEEDVADRAIGEIVTCINRDLGISGLDDDRAGRRRIPHDIAILNARADQSAGVQRTGRLPAAGDG